MLPGTDHESLFRVQYYGLVVDGACEVLFLPEASLPPRLDVQARGRVRSPEAVGRSPGAPRGGILPFSGERHCLGDPDGPAAQAWAQLAAPFPQETSQGDLCPGFGKTRLRLASARRGGSSQGPAWLEGASS